MAYEINSWCWIWWVASRKIFSGDCDMQNLMIHFEGEARPEPNPRQFAISLHCWQSLSFVKGIFTTFLTAQSSLLNQVSYSNPFIQYYLTNCQIPRCAKLKFQNKIIGHSSKPGEITFRFIYFIVKMYSGTTNVTSNDCIAGIGKLL